MSADERLVVELTRGIVATDGVRGIFPESVVSGAAATLVKFDRSSATGLLRLARDQDTLVLTARIAVDVNVPSAIVAANVQTTARRVLGSTPFRLHLEIAHLT